SRLAKYMKVAIALGSNLGNGREHLDLAVDELKRFLRDVRVSSILETDPVGVPDEQPKYLNAVVVGETELPAEELLDKLIAAERARGRVRKSDRSARTLDLDIILYAGRIVRAPTLEIPHPTFRESALGLG